MFEKSPGVSKNGKLLCVYALSLVVKQFVTFVYKSEKDPVSQKYSEWFSTTRASPAPRRPAVAVAGVEQSRIRLHCLSSILISH